MPDTFRVLVTGSRTWADRSVIYRELNALLNEHGSLVVVHGACPARPDGTPGADQIADDWFRAAREAGALVFVERHPARWKVNGRVDKGAGFARNAEMVATAPDLVLAFLMPCTDPKCHKVPHGSHGAAHCAGLAEQARIETRRFTDG